MLFVLGSIFLLLGTCAGVSLLTLKSGQLETLKHDLEKNIQGLPPEMFNTEAMTKANTRSAIICFVVGPILIAFGVFVRRASKVATVFATIVCGLLLLYMALDVVADLLMGFTGNPVMALGACVALVPAFLFGLATAWLMQLLRALPNIQAAQQQWQAYYAAAQQQQQTHQQGPVGYGYGVPPPANYGQPPQGGAPPGQTPYGYGAPPIPGAPPADQGSPPTRHPPLPPDQQDGGGPPQG
jgi:hypothetical protein